MASFNRIPRMFRLPSHRVFDYKPRFYDIEREKFEQLKKRKEAEQRSKSENGVFKTDHSENIREAFSRRRVQPGTIGSQKNYSLRVLLIVVILSALFYVFFFT